MPARSHPVPTALWGRRFRSLSPGAKLVALYALTCPHRRSEGLYELAPAHAAVDTGLEVERVEKALAELTESGLLLYDFDAELVLDPDALRVSPLRNGVTRDGEPRADKRIDPAVRHFELLPPSPLKARFVAIADEASPDLAAAIRAHLGTSWEAPLEGPSEGASAGASARGSQAPSRVGSGREEVEGPPDAADQGESPLPCHWCGDPALVTAGELQVAVDQQGNERPYCGWCDTQAAGAA